MEPIKETIQLHSSNKDRINNKILRQYEKSLVEEIQLVTLFNGKLSYNILGTGFSLLKDELTVNSILESDISPDYLSGEPVSITMNKLISMCALLLAYNKHNPDELSPTIVFFFDRIIHCVKKGYYLNFIIHSNRDKITDSDFNRIKECVNKEKATFTLDNRNIVESILAKYISSEKLSGAYTSYIDLINMYKD